MRLKAKFLLTVFVLGVCSSLCVSMAATRKVCYRMLIRDNRTNCATKSETGARRPCQGVTVNSTKYVWAKGHRIELWDYDSSGGDEFIGSYIIGGEGARCITFEWENASYSKGEANPDVYIKMPNVVRKSNGTGRIVTAKTSSGGNHSKTSWRNGSKYWNCKTGTSCYINGSGYLYPTNDASSERGKRFMALDSAQHTLQIYGGILRLDMELRYPGKSSCSTSCSTSQTVMHIAESRGNNGGNVSHEVGHNIQKQEFRQNSLRNNCNMNDDGGHSVTTSSEQEYDSCATQEGWADYVATVSWYDPNNSSVTNPKFWGMNIESPTPRRSTCSENRGYELQVAKAFWDLDDTRNESGSGAASSWDDLKAYSTTYIAQQWDDFADGTGNRDDYENDDNGVNVKDYYYNNSGDFGSNFYETLLRHNCLQYQDYN